MFFGTISEVITKHVSNSTCQQALTPWLFKRPSLVLPALILLALLPSWPAQAAIIQFDDLAARAAAARVQGNLNLAIDLYGQAEQLKPDWAEGWFYLGLLQYSSDHFTQGIEAFNHLLQLQ